MKERLVLLGCVLLGGLLAAGLLAVLVKKDVLKMPAPAAPVSVAAAPSCAIRANTPACDACMNASCGGACETCATNPSCLKLYVCMLDCTEAACRRECVTAHPAGKAAFEAFAGTRGCMASSCKDACK